MFRVRNSTQTLSLRPLTFQFSLRGRTALVTGGARGCGLAFAQGVAEAGADVAIFDVIQPDEAFHALGERYGVRAVYYECVQHFSQSPRTDII